MPMVRALSSENLPQPKFRYSPMVQAGPFYKTAGMVALDIETGQLESGGVSAETLTILKNLMQALPDFNLTLDDLMSVHIFTTRFDQFAAINAAWESVFTDDIRPPARTAVGVSELPLGAQVEIEFMFYKVPEREKND